METRANHLLIGSFVLAFVAAIFIFVIWLAKVQIDQELAYYHVNFTGSVTGLGVGSDVRFNGIKVGSVTDIAFHPDDPRQVTVTVEIDADTPIRDDSMASLEPQGITGLSYVLISGGSREAKRLPVVKRATAQLPDIASKPSKLAELFEGAPDMVNRAIVLIERASDLLNDENRRNISNIVADLRSVTGAVASREAAIGRIIDSFDKTSVDVAETAKAVRSIADRVNRIAETAEVTLGTADRAFRNVDELVTGDVKALVKEGRQTAQSLGQLADEMQGMVAENRAPLHDFAGEGLNDLRRFINEARILIASFSRVATRLEEEPTQVLFGNRDAEYRPEGK